MKVRNMTSPRSGREVANQFCIYGENKTVFQSYSSTIVTLDYENKVISLGEDWDYSRTTGRYRNQFFEEQGFSDLASTKGLTDALKQGKYEDWTIVSA